MPQSPVRTESGRARVPYQVSHIEKDGHHQQHVNQNAGYVKQKKAAGPQNNQRQGNLAERVEVHFLLPSSASERWDREYFSFISREKDVSVSAKGCKSLTSA